MLAVAEHYYQLGGQSPINEQVRKLTQGLAVCLAFEGPHLPIYWGNRNWHPLLADTMQTMADDGVGRALAFVTSAYSSYSSCRQYLEDIERARQQVGPAAPVVDKIRVFYNHPEFIEAMVECVREALDQIPKKRRTAASIVYTAHSIPVSMACNCRYEAQLREAARLISVALDRPESDVVYQSRSGPPSQPWLEPDICDYLRQHRPRDAVVVPLGFVSDHMEIRYDLDIAARRVCKEVGTHMVRAATVGLHPRFIHMVRELIVERLEERRIRPALGDDGPGWDVCASDCCPAPARPGLGARD